MARISEPSADTERALRSLATYRAESWRVPAVHRMLVGPQAADWFRPLLAIYSIMYNDTLAGVYGGGLMSRTVIDLDDDALEAAAKELGTSTKRDTINTALREVVARNRRLRALHELQDLADEGALDIEFLLDKRNYRGGSAR